MSDVVVVFFKSTTDFIANNRLKYNNVEIGKNKQLPDVVDVEIAVVLVIVIEVVDTIPVVVVVVAVSIKVVV